MPATFLGGMLCLRGQGEYGPITFDGLWPMFEALGDSFMMFPFSMNFLPCFGPDIGTRHDVT